MAITKNLSLATAKKTKLIDLPKCDLQPRGDRVIVWPLEAEEKVGMIIIPDTAKDRSLKAIVIAAGPGTEEVRMDLRRGEVISYGKYSGTEYTYEGTTFIIMRVFDIQCDVVNPY